MPALGVRVAVAPGVFTITSPVNVGSDVLQKRSLWISGTLGASGSPLTRLRCNLAAWWVLLGVCKCIDELRLGFSNTTRNPEGILSHNNRKS